jgi:hypothetical protein
MQARPTAINPLRLSLAGQLRRRCLKQQVDRRREDGDSK